MNKKFKEYLESCGFTVNGNTAYGNFKGYESNFTVSNFDNVSPVTLHISLYATDEQKRNIEAALRNAAIKFFKFQFTPYGLLLGIGGFTMGKILKQLPALTDLVYGIINEQGAVGEGFCPVCGNPLTEAVKCTINGYTVTMDVACKNNINAVINAENQDFNNAPNNYLAGFAGAVIGGIAGAVVAVLIYMAGFISSISAIISILLGSFLYTKFHGKPNKMMLVIVSVTTLVFMIASVFGVYIIEAGIAAEEVGVDMSAIEAFKLCMEDSEFASIFYTDLGMIILFTAIGIGVEIFYMYKKIKRQQNIM